MSKTTKLLLLDSLLQEVCIESGSDGSLALSSLGLSVCLVSHILLYSGLKKVHLKMETKLIKCMVHCVTCYWIKTRTSKDVGTYAMTYDICCAMFFLPWKYCINHTSTWYCHLRKDCFLSSSNRLFLDRLALPHMETNF